MIDISYQKYLPTVKYKRNSLDCYLCSARKKLIISTPEENVRQAVINYFVEFLQIPVANIRAEVSMSYYASRQKGRADIIVSDDEDNPLILVECKAPNQFLADAVTEQVFRYDDIIKSKVVVVTNGSETLAFERESAQLIHQLSRIPTYYELLRGNGIDHFYYDEVPYQRFDLSQVITDEISDEYIDMGLIGEDTSSALYPFLFNIIGWIFDASDQVPHSSLHYLSIIEDGGIRLAEFGNAGGSAYGTVYRYFILKDSKGDNQIVSITIIGTAKLVDDPQWHNRSSATMLAVAIDDFKSSHLSLQLRLDKYVSLAPGIATIWHDGTLTVGKLGQAKRQAVVDYIAGKAPHLLNKEGKIVLGVFDLTQEIRSSQPQTKSFLDNLMLYALLRDEYRQLHKEIVK